MKRLAAALACLALSSSARDGTAPPTSTVRRLLRFAPAERATRVSASSCSVAAMTKSMENNSIMRIDWNGEAEKQAVRPVAKVVQALVKPKLDDSPGRQSSEFQLNAAKPSARRPMSATVSAKTFGSPVDPEVRHTRHTSPLLENRPAITPPGWGANRHGIVETLAACPVGGQGAACIQVEV